MCFQWEGNQECAVMFHEQRAAQTLSPSVKISTSGTEGSDFSVFAFLLFFFKFSQNFPLSAEEQTAAKLLNLQTGKEMEFSVEEVIRAWNVSIPKPLILSAAQLNAEGADFGIWYLSNEWNFSEIGLSSLSSFSFLFYTD